MTAPLGWRAAAPFVVLALLCVVLAIVPRAHWLRLMSLHMLVQIPLLVLAGLAAHAAWRRLLPKPAPDVRVWSYNSHGVPGLVLVSLIGAFWMIPKALDDALVDWRVAAFKYLGLPLCGWILGASMRRSVTVVKLFFLGDFCWMSAIVGMLYLDQPVRLCNAYLQDDQVWAGRGLIALAVLWPTLWLLLASPPARRWWAARRVR